MRLESGRSRPLSDQRGLPLRRFLPARPHWLEVLPFLDSRAKQLAGPFGIGLRATLELGGRPADQAARRAVATAVEARVTMRAVHLECAVWLKESQRLGLGYEQSRIHDHQYASTTDFFSR